VAGAEAFFLRNVDRGRFEAANAAPVLWGRFTVASDFDGDGDSDLAVLDSRGQIGLLRGSSGGGFVSPIAASTGNDPDSVGLVDVDGDEDLDVVAAN